MRLEGLNELQKTVQAMQGKNAFPPGDVESLLLEGAVIIADRVRQKAPLGPTGRLKKSIVAKSLRRLTGDFRPAIAAVDRKIAPHAWLVENGHLTTGGKHVAAHPYFRPGVDESERQAADHVLEGFEKLADEAMK